MMSMNYPHTNKNSTGQQLYATAVCPNIRVNYNHYFAPFYPNSNGLLPTPKFQPLMNHPPLHSVPKPTPMIKSCEQKDDFLSFIEQKSQQISDLNPFANEFSLMTTTQKSNKQIVPMNNSINPAYKVIFDDLIEQSLQSIDAIKKASQITAVKHVSTQCQPSIDLINRSTQTDQYQQIIDYSTRTINLMRNLLENFKYLSRLSSNTIEINTQLKSMSNIFDELNHLILLINQQLTSNQFLSLERDTLFSNIIKNHSIQSSPIIYHGKERLISSTPIYSTITTNRSKICLLCRKIIDDSDDVMHKLCRLLSYPPDT